MSTSIEAMDRSESGPYQRSGRDFRHRSSEIRQPLVTGIRETCSFQAE